MAKERWLAPDDLPYPPRTEVLDTRTGRPGLLMGGIVTLTADGRAGRRVLYLRPVDGGPEWPARPGDLEPVRP